MVAAIRKDLEALRLLSKAETLHQVAASIEALLMQAEDMDDAAWDAFALSLRELAKSLEAKAAKIDPALAEHLNG